AGEAAARLLVDELAEAVVEAQLARLDRQARQGLVAAKLGELAHAVRQEVDAHAQRPDFGRRLENPAGNARLVERQGERQAADPAAADGERRLPLLHEFIIAPLNCLMAVTPHEVRAAPHPTAGAVERTPCLHSR